MASLAKRTQTRGPATPSSGFRCDGVGRPGKDAGSTLRENASSSRDRTAERISQPRLPGWMRCTVEKRPGAGQLTDNVLAGCVRAPAAARLLAPDPAAAPLRCRERRQMERTALHPGLVSPLRGAEEPGSRPPLARCPGRGPSPGRRRPRPWLLPLTLLRAALLGSRARCRPGALASLGLNAASGF